VTASKRRLRIAVLADFEGPHPRRWLDAMVRRGHEMHAISFYRPTVELPGVRLHALKDGPASLDGAGPNRATGALRRLPASLLRYGHALRYSRAGLRGLLRDLAPDVLHAHYVVEHGFYGALAGFHPYVVSGWGSDLYREPSRPQGWLAAKWALTQADVVTANEAAMADRLQDLGVPPDKIEIVRIGAVDELFLSPEPPSINRDARFGLPFTLISDRALEPLYNVDVILRSFVAVHERWPQARLIVVHDGSQRQRLEGLARELGIGSATRFAGRLTPPQLRKTLSEAQVYVSVPSSDSMAASTMEAMAAGCLPVVSDLPSQDLIEHGVNGLRVRPGDVRALQQALFAALSDADLRDRAVSINLARVAAAGSLDDNAARLEQIFYELVD
jgi:glycosyltransferase involved in cell wall biosynthesis